MVFVKGDPRINMHGRPKGSYTLLGLLKRELHKIPPGEKSSRGAKIVEALILKATNEKDVAALKLIFNYIEGMPGLSLDLTSGGSKLTALIEIQKQTQSILNDKS